MTPEMSGKCGWVGFLWFLFLRMSVHWTGHAGSPRKWLILIHVADPVEKQRLFRGIRVLVVYVLADFHIKARQGVPQLVVWDFEGPLPEKQVLFPFGHPALFRKGVFQRYCGQNIFGTTMLETTPLVGIYGLTVTFEPSEARVSERSERFRPSSARLNWGSGSGTSTKPRSVRRRRRELPPELQLLKDTKPETRNVTPDSRSPTRLQLDKFRR